MNSNKPIEKFQLSNIKHIFIVASGKGGVGKSTVAAILALSLAKKGYRTGLLDADMYGPSIPTIFGIENERPATEEIDGKTWIEPLEKNDLRIISLGFFIKPDQAVLWRGPMVTNALKQLLNDTHWGELDYLIIDTPPGTGDIHITLIQQFNIDGAIIVTTPQLMALADVQKAISMFQEPHINVPVLAIVENMAWFTPSIHPEERYFLFGEGGGQYLSETYNIPLLVQLPTNEIVCQNCDYGHPEKILEENIFSVAFEKLIQGITTK